MSRAFLRPALAALLLLAAALPARAQPSVGELPLLTDLSSHLIAITSNFTGTELLLFGALDEPGDVIVVVRGPTSPAVVRRKERVAGIWMNTDSIEFGSVPTYYAVAASRPLYEIASPGLLARLQIGDETLRFRPVGDYRDAEVAPFRAAIVRTKERQELYREEIGQVAFLGQKLFRTRIGFPSTVTVGTYRVEVYLIRDDRVIAAQATPLFVDKQGFEQALFEFAHQQPLLYGFAAVLMAAAAGWAAAALFNRS